eukprot:Nk52_evm24s162 gene=Nk52_evmTU24s162
MSGDKGQSEGRAVGKCAKKNPQRKKSTKRKKTPVTFVNLREKYGIVKEVAEKHLTSCAVAAGERDSKGKSKGVKKNEVSESKNAHQKLIATFHALKKKEEICRSRLENPAMSVKEEKTSLIKELKEIEESLEKLGGIEAYQRSSLRGEALHNNNNTSKWILGVLKESLLTKRNSGDDKISMLDVGALSCNYVKYSKQIACRYIDLNPQAAGVERMDFFDLEKEFVASRGFQMFGGDYGFYNVINLSLVINFVPDVHKRGKMLRQCATYLREGGFLNIIVPLPCVSNSRYMTEEKLLEILTYLGFELKVKHSSKKLAYFHLILIDKAKALSSTEGKFGKELLRAGADRNNFCIVL